MKEKSKFHAEYLMLCIIVAAAVAVSVFVGLRRNIIHVDEVLSFGLANNTSGKYWFEWGTNGDIIQAPLPDADDFFNHWQDGSLFNKYVTVQENERFRYDIPYKYQYTDVSPPLYYCMIHTMSSLFPEQFSIWFGLIPNIIFYALCIPILYHIAKKLLKNNVRALFAVAFWAFSRAAISDVNYVRMYMLTTLELLLSIMLHLELLQSKGRKPYLLLIPIFFVNLAGFLTQNYMFIITFFMTVFICIVLLFRKKVRLFFIFGSVELLSVEAELLIFPASFAQMTRSAYGYNAFNGLSHLSKSSKVGLLSTLINNLFGGTVEDSLKADAAVGRMVLSLMIVITAVLVLLLIFFFLSKLHIIRLDEKSSAKVKSLWKKLKRKTAALIRSGRFSEALFLILIPVISGIVIDYTSPDMTLFKDRYYFPLMPLCFLIAAFAVFTAARMILRRIKGKNIKAENILICILGTAMIAVSVTGNFIGKNYFLYHEDGLTDLRADFADKNCVIMTGSYLYLVHNYAVYFMDSDKVFPAYYYSGELEEAVRDTETDYIMISDNEYESIKKLLPIMSETHSVEDLGSHFLNEDTFYIYKLSPIGQTE